MNVKDEYNDYYNLKCSCRLSCCVCVKVQIQDIGRKCEARSLRVWVRASTNKDCAEERINACICANIRYFYFQDMSNM